MVHERLLNPLNLKYKGGIVNIYDVSPDVSPNKGLLSASSIVEETKESSLRLSNRIMRCQMTR